MPANLAWDPADVVTTVLALGGGLLLARAARRWQRRRRARRMAAVDGRLRELATAMGGAFHQGPPLTEYRRLLGDDAREYGCARVISDGLEVEVSVIYPGDHPFEDHTSIKVLRPAGRRPMVEGLRMRAAPPPGADPHAQETFARAFPEMAPAELPAPELRRALLALAARASALELTADHLIFIAAPSQATVPEASATSLRALAVQVAAVVAMLASSSTVSDPG